MIKMIMMKRGYKKVLRTFSDGRQRFRSSNFYRLGRFVLFFTFLQSAKFFICVAVYSCYFLAMIMMKSLRFVLFHGLGQKNIEGRALSFFKSIESFFCQSDKSLLIYEFLKSPRNIGSICPSSKRLANYMALQVSLSDDRFVVELGAGTGIVTSALLQRGIKPEQLIVIEKSPQLVQYLKKYFPNVLIIEEDAANLVTVLARLGKLNVGNVVSSLPLRSLPIQTVQMITTQISQLLDDKGQYIQFSYDLRKKRADNTYEKFSRAHTKTIWLNFPPALVSAFVPKSL